MPTQSFQLTMRSGPTPGKTYPLEQEEILLGRDNTNDIVISDPEVSRRHTRFMMKFENFFVEDLGSTNGTFLNGERITSPQPLRPGDVIIIGESIVLIYDRVSYDPDVTAVMEGAEEPLVEEEMSAAEFYEQPPEFDTEVPPQPVPEGRRRPQSKKALPADADDQEKKGGLPTCLIIGIVAIVVMVCVIAVTMYFMPAAWWCAIDLFGMIEACPLP